MAINSAYTFLCLTKQFFYTGYQYPLFYVSEPPFYSSSNVEIATIMRWIRRYDGWRKTGPSPTLHFLMVESTFRSFARVEEPSHSWPSASSWFEAFIVKIYFQGFKPLSCLCPFLWSMIHIDKTLVAKCSIAAVLHTNTRRLMVNDLFKLLK